MSQQPKFPQPPPPRSDVPPPDGLSPEQQQIYTSELAMTSPAAWLDTDGNLWLWRMPASMAPAIGHVDSPVMFTPDQPGYGTYIGDVLPEYDYRGKEMPSAQGADSHAQGR